MLHYPFITNEQLHIAYIMETNPLLTCFNANV